MKKRTNIYCVIICMLLLPLDVKAQKPVALSGSNTYTVTDEMDISLSEAKRRSIELAKAAAIRRKFGEIVTSDVIETNVEANGQTTNSQYWENTVAMAKGEWLNDTKPPLVDIVYVNGKLLITAEVHGLAREIIQAKTDLKWEIQKDDGTQRKTTSQFTNGERFYINFRSPADGYVAVYLMVGDDETVCLLPYPKDTDGRHPIKGNRDYVFFDKDTDPSAPHYTLTTKRQQEINQIVIIYSPNSFMKCNDITGDAKHPNSLSTHDFQKWLLKCQRVDKDMVVDKKWINIKQNSNN